jgi:hypothetical protein
MRQTGRGRQAGRQTGRQADRQTGRQASRAGQAGRQASKQGRAGRKASRQADRQAGASKQAGRQGHKFHNSIIFYIRIMEKIMESMEKNSHEILLKIMLKKL